MEISLVIGNSHQIVADTCVVIDVLRASSVHFCLLQNGVQKIYLAKSSEDAFNLKKEIPDALLVGESKGLKIKGFDLGNSPSEILSYPRLPVDVIHKTTNGTQALILASKSREVFSVGLNGASSIISYLRSKKSDIGNLTLVATHPTSDEDQAVAEYIINEVRYSPSSLGHVQERVRNAECARKFADVSMGEFPEEDLVLCNQLSDDNFVMKLNRAGSKYFLERGDL